jgi:energy-converting hydrogenase B subunit D
MMMLLGAILILTAGAGAAVVLVRDPLHQTLWLGLHGLVLTLLLLVLRAPDVALAQIVVGGAAIPLMFLAAIANARMRGPKE